MGMLGVAFPSGLDPDVTPARGGQRRERVERDEVCQRLGLQRSQRSRSRGRSRLTESSGGLKCTTVCSLKALVYFRVMFYGQGRIPYGTR